MNQVNGSTRLFCIVASVAILALGACSDSAVGERTSSISAAVTGGDATNVTFATTLPEQAVGQVQFPGYTCSGTLILRNVVLTAAHCFLNSANNGYATIPLSSIQFDLPYAPSSYVSVKASDWQATIWDIASQNPTTTGPPESYAQQDMAVIFLVNNIGANIIPSLPAVYTSTDFIDRVFNTADTNFFGDPKRLIGFSGSSASAPQRTAGTIHQLRIENDCGFLGDGSCSGYWVDDEKSGLLSV